MNEPRGIDAILDKWRGIIKSRKRMIISLEEVIQLKLESLRPWIFSDREPVEGWMHRHFNYDRHRERTWIDDAWKPIKVGETWGGPDVSAYFKLDAARIPERFKGQKVALRVYFSGDGLLRVNGEAYHGLDPFRDTVFLTDCAKGDEQYDFEAECYIMWHFGEGEVKNFEVSEWAVFDPEMDKAYWDLRAAFNLLVTEGIPSDLVAHLREVLHEATKPIERECRDGAKVKALALEAQRYVREKIYEDQRFRRQGLLHLVGNSHLDLVYLWNHAEYERKLGRTHATQLRMLEEYPEMIFSQSQPQMYDRMKELYPELYAQVKERVKEGRWEPVGAFWVEPDCNLISGESMVRQVLHGVRFYQEEFGVTPTTAWIPDVFGNAWSMPQILVKSGLKYFVTHKMNIWNDTNKWTRHAFWWEGPDGSRIFSTVPPTHFMGMCEPDHLNDHWDHYNAKAEVPESLYCYGWGDGGGGPDREMMEYAHRYRDFPGVPKSKFSRIEDALERMRNFAVNRDDIPVINDELYLEEHRGVYTTKGRLKKANRYGEFLLRNAEMWSVFAGNEYPVADLDKAWKILLTTQFHDSLPGTHTTRAYEEIKDMLAECFALGEGAESAALESLAARVETAGPGQPVVVFNAQPFDRSTLVQVPCEAKAAHVVDPVGVEIPSQFTRDFETGVRVIVFRAESIPSCGYAVYRVVAEAGQQSFPTMEPGPGTLENDHVRIRFNEAGEIVSLLDKETERECIDPEERGNVFRMFEDMPGMFDAWDIEMHYEDTEFPLPAGTVEPGEQGAVFSSLILKRQINDSTVEQHVTLGRGARRIEFRTRIDWKERHKLLKVRFNTTLRSRQATYDIPYANMERPTTRNNSFEEAKFEVCGHQWMDLSQPDFGLSLLTDCKYGYEARDQMIGLTLLKGPMYPDPESDIEEHTFTYALYPHASGWREAGTIEEAADLNDPVRVVPERGHDGELPSVQAFLSLNQPGVTLEAVKQAEDGKGIVARVVERHGANRAVTLSGQMVTGKALDCDLLEKGEGEIEANSASVSMEMKPYEIRTLRFG